MKNITITLIAVLLAFSPAAHAADSGLTTESPPALLIDGETFDPICFLNDWSGTPPEESGDGVSFYPTEGCRIGEITVDPVSHDDSPHYVGASYAEDFYDDANDEVYTTRGYIAYRYVGDYNGHKAIIVSENSGGSGTFSTIALYDLIEKDSPDGPQTFLHKMETLAGGDRCMGGISNAVIKNGTLTFTQNATPYDMLFLTGDSERAILQSEAAEQIITCAVCCYAHAHFTPDGLTGITLNKDILPRLEPDNDGAMGCFDNLVKLNLEHDTGIFDADETESFIHEIEHVCLGRMEGE